MIKCSSPVDHGRNLGKIDVCGFAKKIADRRQMSGDVAVLVVENPFTAEPVFLYVAGLVSRDL